MNNQIRPTIILEGIDRAGKTTFANSLIEEFGFAYFHPSKPINPEGFFQREEINYRLSLLFENCIIDRSPISHFAYDNRVDFSFFENWRINTEIYILIFLPSNRFIREAHPDNQRMITINERYKIVASKLPHHCHKIEYDNFAELNSLLDQYRAHFRKYNSGEQKGAFQK